MQPNNVVIYRICFFILTSTLNRIQCVLFQSWSANVSVSHSSVSHVPGVSMVKICPHEPLADTNFLSR